MDIREALEKGILTREPARPGELQQLLAGLTRRLSDARRPQNYHDTQAAEAVEEAVWLSERLQRWIEDQDRVAPKDPPTAHRNPS